MSDKPFKVSVQGPGISIEREVGEGVLPRLLSILLTDALPEAGAFTAAATVRHDQNTSIGEFLSDLKISSNPERIAGVALFAREVLGRERILREEIPEWFQRAGQPAPKNLFRDLKNAVAQRLISEDHARAGEYLVTETGVKALRGQPIQPGARASSPPKRARTAGAAKKSAAAASDGPTAKIQELVGEDWFAAPRTVSDLLIELAARGTHYKSANVTLQMQTMVKEKKLRRQKKVPEGGKKEVWHYSNW